MLHRAWKNGAACAAILLGGALAAIAAQPSAPAAATGATASGWTTQQDHQHMLQQLGITRLRPGRNANADQPNAANYDEALANPFPKLPELLRMENGQPVTTARQWREQRRPELVELFEREVVGRIPANVPKVNWSITGSETFDLAGQKVNARRVVGRVDNSAHPAIEVNIDLLLVTPADARGPVPVMIMFGRGRLPSDPAPARRGGPGGPGGARAGDPPAAPAAPQPPREPPATEQLIAAGWGYAYLDPGSVQADNGAGLTRGVIGLTNKGQPRKPDDWGSLRAWGWGASRALDYFETDRSVDARRVGIEGVSRYGKAALVTMAFDERFAVALVASSGEGGAKLHRRNFGEAVENLTASGEYHWMAGNFLKYGAEEASFGRRDAGDIPVDAHQLIALCAPRATFVSYGVPELGDALWLDQQGSFMATVAAQPVFRLLGMKDLGRPDDYTKEVKPAVNESLLDGRLAWRQHDGGHTSGPNWKHFIPWAKRELDAR
ncbi:MAG TPA: hypothetical protein VMK82_05195 [Steroidobacteraceae bacterium]|nr:hypothetical protein [Steroidobacteraceae bacterium]